MIEASYFRIRDVFVTDVLSFSKRLTLSSMNVLTIESMLVDMMMRAYKFRIIRDKVFEMNHERDDVFMLYQKKSLLIDYCIS
jgi:hypothetical protein